MSGQGATIELRVAGAPVVEFPSAWHGCVAMARRNDESVLTLTDETQLQPLLALRVQKGVEVRAVSPQRATLEELFMAAASDAAIRAPGARRSA